VQYADPARALALRGAEMILMPIWGGNQTLGKARAIENRVFLISSGYDYPLHS
jgi:predicted amidohydrolase